MVCLCHICNRFSPPPPSFSLYVCILSKCKQKRWFDNYQSDLKSSSNMCDKVGAKCKFWKLVPSWISCIFFCESFVNIRDWHFEILSLTRLFWFVLFKYTIILRTFYHLHYPSPANANIHINEKHSVTRRDSTRLSADNVAQPIRQVFPDIWQSRLVTCREYQLTRLFSSHNHYFQILRTSLTTNQQVKHI